MPVNETDAENYGRSEEEDAIAAMMMLNGDTNMRKLLQCRTCDTKSVGMYHVQKPSNVVECCIQSPAASTVMLMLLIASYIFIYSIVIILSIV